MAPVAGVHVLVRLLLAPSTFQLGLGFFATFYAHLLREHRAKEWFQLATFAAHVDAVFSTGLLFSIMAVSFFGLGFCSMRGATCGATWAFPLVAGATVTLGWSSVVRLADAHELEVSCVFPKSYLAEMEPASAGFFAVWCWRPTGAWRLVRAALAQPWGRASKDMADPDHSTAWDLLEWWEWREFVMGVSFWAALLLCFILAPSFARSRSFADFRGPSVWLGLCLSALGVSLATWMSFNLTLEPLMWFWAFMIGSVAKCRALAGKPWPPPPERPLPEEALAAVLALWFAARLAYVFASARIERWAARERCEASLRRALEHPFRADLEQGFADLEQGFADLEQGLARGPSVWPSPPEAANAGNLCVVQEKRRALIKARRGLLRREVGGDAALPRTLHLKIRRSHLLADTWRAMVEHPVTELLSPSLVVEYEGEGGIDAGGVARDWFDAVGKALAEGGAGGSGAGILASAPDGTLLPGPVAAGEHDLDPVGGAGWEPLMALLATGRLIAFAVLSAHPLPLSLSPIVCKYLLEHPISTEDVRRLDPDFFRGRVEALHGAGALARLEAALGEPLAFVSAPSDRRPEPEELVPGGVDLVVSEANKAEYLPLLCEAYLCSGVRREIQCLLQGFWELLPLQLLREQDVGPGELSVLIAGIQDLDPRAWRRHSATPANGGTVCQWFWEILEEDLGPDERCLLLHFATGSSRLLPGGFAELRPPFSLEVSELQDADHLPHAHTCINRLVLHRYRSRAQLKEKLLVALTADGFAFS